MIIKRRALHRHWSKLDQLVVDDLVNNPPYRGSIEFYQYIQSPTTLICRTAPMKLHEGRHGHAIYPSYRCCPGMRGGSIVLAQALASGAGAAGLETEAA